MNTETRGVPDPIHHTDLGETLEYIQGWNDCRQAMLEKLADHHDPIGTAQDMLIAEQAAQHSTAQQEPLTGGDERRHIICLCPDCTKPAQRTWVGLTEEEKTELRRKHYPLPLLLMDATEAKLMEKNA